jgi:hypothetical protein
MAVRGIRSRSRIRRKHPAAGRTVDRGSFVWAVSSALDGYRMRVDFRDMRSCLGTMTCSHVSHGWAEEAWRCCTPEQARIQHMIFKVSLASKARVQIVIGG